MAYTTLTDVRNVLSAEGKADTATAASLSDGALQAAIDDATAEVNVRLAARYDVPFDDDRLGQARPVPDVVRTLTRDIAAYKATLTYRRGAPLDQYDPSVLRYNAADKLLTAIVRGTATLSMDNSPSADQAAATEGATFNRNTGPLFTETDMGVGPWLQRRSPGGFPWSTY